MIRPKFTSGRRVGTADDLKQPGDWCLYDFGTEGQATLSFLCPCGGAGCVGDRRWVTIYVKAAPEREQGYWNWDGDRVQPTLSPSIHRKSGCGWHGYFEKGQWRTV